MKKPKSHSIVSWFLVIWFLNPDIEIGIITPYNYQVKLIEQRLIQRNLHQQKIDIGTVDAFQGRQKDVILLSCVRATQTTTDPTTTIGIGFVANRQRLNVSLTRAKYAMYILGHMNSLNVK
jgi:senataxin